jgi:serine/threonine protein kinase
MGLARGDHVDRYRIESLLGKGSYGESYLATDTDAGLPVVLKPANRSLVGSWPLAHRFRLEAALGRRLDHPNVQSGRDDGRNRSQPYLLVEYVDGTSVRSRLADDAGGWRSLRSSIGARSWPPGRHMCTARDSFTVT